jgi:hypothetical protein
MSRLFVIIQLILSNIIISDHLEAFISLISAKKTQNKLFITFKENLLVTV